jgi:hypothetical protein
VTDGVLVGLILPPGGVSGLLGDGAGLGEDDGEGAGLDDAPGEPLSDRRPEPGKPP